MTDKPESKPAKKAAREPRKSAVVLNFPAPRADYYLSCPECDKVRWKLKMIDVKKGDTASHSVAVLQCLTRGCGYETGCEIDMGSEHYD